MSYNNIALWTTKKTQPLCKAAAREAFAPCQSPGWRRVEEHNSQIQRWVGTQWRAWAGVYAMLPTCLNSLQIHNTCKIRLTLSLPGKASNLESWENRNGRWKELQMPKYFPNNPANTKLGIGPSEMKCPIDDLCYKGEANYTPCSWKE